MSKMPDKIPENDDEAALRAFYQSCGINMYTTEAAIKARRNKPVDEPKPPSPWKGKKRKSVRV